jgi:hypothetical protein
MNGPSRRAPSRPPPRAAHRKPAGLAGARKLIFRAPEPRRGRAFGLIGVALSVLLSACVETGDFGRPRPSIWNDALSTTGSIAAGARGEPVSAYVFTDDEEELRRRAWRFLMPAHERAWFERQLANVVRARVLPVAAQPNGRAVYFAALMSDHGRSPASRYRRLSEDVFADAKLIEPFAFAAARVITADEARLRALAYVRELTAEQAREAALRVGENRCLIAWVRWEIEGRTAAYRYALEHLFIEAPQADGVPVERTLRGLEAHRALLDGLPGGPWSPTCGVPAATDVVAVAPIVASDAVVVKD